MSDIELCVLETDGAFSFFTSEAHDDAGDGELDSEHLGGADRT